MAIAEMTVSGVLAAVKILAGCSGDFAAVMPMDSYRWATYPHPGSRIRGRITNVAEGASSGAKAALKKARVV